jgi:hypothetical protein
VKKEVRVITDLNEVDEEAIAGGFIHPLPKANKPVEEPKPAKKKKPKKPQKEGK